MAEEIKSTDMLKPDAISAGFKNVGKFEYFLDRLPETIRVLGAILIIALVAYLCQEILFSHDEELKQFKQAAFTALVGFGSGAIGFLFGSWTKSST